MSTFDYQWANLPCKLIEYNSDRVREFRDFTKLPAEWFKGKKALDCGCGNGRYTYVMQLLGCDVTSFDFSIEAVKKCQEVNPKAYQFNLFDLDDKPEYDFILSFGVLHHTSDPALAFQKVAAKVKKGGIFHVYLYSDKSQPRYEPMRRIFRVLRTNEEKLAYVKSIVQREGGNVHSWWDALSPDYNWGLNVATVRSWYEKAGFKEIRVIQEFDIHINGKK